MQSLLSVSLPGLHGGSTGDWWRGGWRRRWRWRRRRARCSPSPGRGSGREAMCRYLLFLCPNIFYSSLLHYLAMCTVQVHTCSFFSVQINLAPQLISAGHQCLPDDQHLVHLLWRQGQLWGGQGAGQGRRHLAGVQTSSWENKLAAVLRKKFLSSIPTWEEDDDGEDLGRKALQPDCSYKGM